MIPAITEIPETPEEKRRRLIIRVSAGAAIVGCLLLASLVFLHLRHVAAVDSWTEEAGDTGRAEALDEALAVLEGDDDPEDLALRARLEATAVLEHGRKEAVAKAEELLNQLEGDDKRLVGAGIARAYLALARTDVARAGQHASTFVAGGAYAAEVSHATAVVALAVGRIEAAVQAASTAVSARSEAPRHVSLLALASARAGNWEGALKTLDALPAEQKISPAVIATRARILFARRGANEEAFVAASQVLKAEDATGPERAWALAIIAHTLARQGEAGEALEKMDTALGSRPPGDEMFTLLALETFLRARAIARAAEQAKALPQGVSGEPARRAQLEGELALEQGRLGRAARFLDQATKDSWTVLLRARLAEAKEDAENAQALYREAAKDSHLLAEAYRRLGAMLIEAGRSAQALELMEQVLAKAPNDPDAVPVMVDALVADGQLDRSSRLVDDALAAKPGDGRLLAARARVEVARGDWKTARETLTQAVAKQPSNPDLHASLGEAERSLGDDEAARVAYEKARAIDPLHPVALVGLLELAVEEESLEEALALLAKVDEIHEVSVRVDRARARVLVMNGAGSDGVTQVRRAIIRRAKDDVDLWLALGELQYQAEKYGGAAAAFGRVLRTDENNPWALLGQAAAQARLRRSVPAEKSLDEASRAARGMSLGKKFKSKKLATEGWLRFADELYGASRRLAVEAAKVDPKNSSAHMLLADIAREREESEKDSLEAVLAGREHFPAAKVRLADILGEGNERACKLAAEYREAAPSGVYRRIAWRLATSCK